MVSLLDSSISAGPRGQEQLLVFFRVLVGLELDQLGVKEQNSSLYLRELLSVRHDTKSHSFEIN